MTFCVNIAFAANGPPPGWTTYHRSRDCSTVREGITSPKGERILETISHWLDRVGPAQYVPAFMCLPLKPMKLHLKSFPPLDADLKELGVAPLGHRRRPLIGLKGPEELS